MTPERWKKVEEIFEAVLQRPPEDRSVFLDRVCEGDITLRNQVDTLLLSLERAGNSMDSPAFGVALTDTMVGEPRSTVIGKRLGNYRIEREIGRGGMGSVYLAVRADDEYKKRVAIKLIKRGMDTDFIVRRFRNERQILASLDHPHIARLFDGGTTDDGLPYFVMEYVEGHPLYRYCDEHKLSINDRLKLFREVCEAVQYAHDNLVIHRDLKPTNILVTSAGIPKLLDFGIAKLLNTDLSSQVSDPTSVAVRMMTPEYASPEQVRGETISAASDVYSLGVLLYELLTDHRPYRIKSHLPEELARVVCEVEPDLPSVAVNLIEVFTVEGRDPIEITPDSVSRARSTTPEQLRRELSGSLDNIVLKAMRKEISKRYSSVEEFSADIGRYLEGHPVSAPSYFPSLQSEADTAEPSTGGRSLAVLPFQVLRVEEKADEFLGMGLADAIITKLSNLERIMVRPTSAVVKYFDGTHNILAAGQELNVGYVLDGRIQRAGDRLRLTVQLVRMRDGNPLWAAKFDENYTDLFSVEDSISEQVANALVPRLTGEEREVLLRRETENSDAYRAFLKGRYFWNRFTPDDFAKALEQFNEAIRLDPEYAQAHVGIADYYNWAAIFGIGAPGENFSQAKAAATRALDLDDSLAEAHAALAFTTLCHDWSWEKAEEGFKRALELNPHYGPAHQWYSNLLAAQGRFDEAISEIKRAQEINPLSLMDRSIAGWTYFHARQYLLAEQELKATLDIDRNFSNSHLMLGFVYERLGRYEESINALNRSMELMSGSVVPLSAMGYVLASSGRFEEARAILEHLKKLGEQRYVSPYFFALIHTSLGERDAAFQCLEKAFEQRDEWLIWLGTEPRLDYLRDDPRFTELLNRVGLKEEKVQATSYARSAAISGGHISATPHFSLNPTGPSTGGTPSLAHAVNAVYRDHRRERAWMIGGAAALVLLAAAFFGYKALMKPAARFATTRIEKLTASGNVVNAAISRDGKYAAYVMDEVGKQGIWVRQMTVANSIRIVPPAETEYRGLTFSNDGTYVYYVVPGTDGNPGVLHQVPALGGSVTEVARGVDSPISFSPDGKQYAFIRSNALDGEDALMISGQNGSEEQQIATRKYPEHFSTSTAPAWSPDGSAMVCVTQTADANGFFMKLTELRLSDRTERELVNKRWQEIGQTAWIPDGSALILTGQDASSGFLHVWRVGYPDGDLRRITNDPNDYRGVSLPSSSDVLLTVQRQTLTSIFVGAKDDPGNTRPVTSGAGRFFDLIWTPEGSILYASDASGAADVWEMAADGTGQKQLTAGAGRNYAPAVTPDGRYVFFHSNRSGSWQIWRMERDGSNPVQMTKDQEESNWPEISPDGKWVLYQHTTGGTPTVWRMPVDGGAASQITTALSMRPAVSPDGESIAVWQKEDKPAAPWKIAIVPFEGGVATKLLDVPQSPATANSVIHWTPDGSGVLFIDFRNGVTNLMLQSFDSSSVKQLTKFTKEQFYSFDFSADGQVLLSRGFWTNDVVLISEAR